MVVTRHGTGRARRDLWPADMEAGLPVEPDTLFRIYSMTKPITSVAAMMLYEEGRFELKDPVSPLAPGVRRHAGVRPAAAAEHRHRPAAEPIRVWHLLTHTAGPHLRLPPRRPGRRDLPRAGSTSAAAGLDLAAASSCWPRIPLLFEPGTEWNYSVATDVLGRLVEVVSASRSTSSSPTRILEPLGMADTRVRHPERSPTGWPRCTPCTAGDQASRAHDARRRPRSAAPVCSPAAVAWCRTAADYLRFSRMLLRGGELDGTRPARRGPSAT